MEALADGYMFRALGFVAGHGIGPIPNHLPVRGVARPPDARGTGPRLLPVPGRLLRLKARA